MSLSYIHPRNGTKLPTFAVVVNPDSPMLLVGPDGGRMAVEFHNTSADDTVFVGADATVTAATGRPIPPGTAYLDDISADAWFGIAAEVANDRSGGGTDDSPGNPDETPSIRVTIIRKPWPVP